MGLDQYAYARPVGVESDDGENNEELTYWRKHNRLHGWMEELWEDRGRPNAGETNPMGDFNCVELELTESDIEQLEAHVMDKVLPVTAGFFFGDDSFDWKDNDGNGFEEGDYYHKERDVEFIKDARKALAEGKKVYYNSWW